MQFVNFLLVSLDKINGNKRRLLLYISFGYRKVILNRNTVLITGSYWKGKIVLNILLRIAVQFVNIIFLMWIIIQEMVQHYCRPTLNFCLFVPEQMCWTQYLKTCFRCEQLSQTKPPNMAQILRTAYARSFFACCHQILC